MWRVPDPVAPNDLFAPLYDTANPEMSVPESPVDARRLAAPLLQLANTYL